MDNSFPQQGSQRQQTRRLFGRLQVLDRIPNWMARLVQMMQLTEEERKGAGIHLAPLTEEEQQAAGIRTDDLRDT